MAYTTTVGDFRGRLTGGGARPSHFKVTLAYPSLPGLASTGLDNDQFLIKAASLPSSTIQTIEVPWKGRIVKVAGERTFANWQVTIINDTAFEHRNKLEKWSNLILNHTKTNGEYAPTAYTAVLTVEQLDRNGDTLKTYEFKDCFPVSIGDISLDFGNANAIEEYNVEFSVDHWETKSQDGEIQTS
jgi:hypothetical protein